MEFKGKITHISEVKTGTTKNDSEWAARDIVVEEESGDYPQKAVFNFFKSGEYVSHVKELYPKVGDVVNVEFNLDASEWNGRWFCKLKAWKIEKLPTTSANNAPAEQAEDDLPF